MNWNQLRIFYYAAFYKSFTRAGERLRISQSAISQHVQSLEDRLEKKLFIRTSQGLELTKAGEILYRHIAKAFSEIDAAENLLRRDEEEEPRGELRVLTTQSLAYSWLIHFVPGFLEQYPDIDLIIHADDHKKDIKGVDVAILPYQANQPELVQRHLVTFQMKLFASQDYLNKFGVPKRLEDLEHHRLITFGEYAPNTCGNLDWLLYRNRPSGRPRKPYLQINSSHGRLTSARLGLGITELGSEHPQLENVNLIEVLPNIKKPVVEMYYIYASQMESSKRITVFADYLETEIKKQEEKRGKLAVTSQLANDG